MFFVSKKVTTTAPYEHFSSKEMAMRSRTEISLGCPATPHGECASLEHTLATALAVLLSLIHSQNWLQLPVCLVRTCKLKQEKKGRSKCISCAEEGWGLFFMIAPLWFNLQIWSTSDLSVAHGSWQLPCEMWSCCQDGFWTLGWEALGLVLSGVGWAVALELTHGSGDAGFTLRAVLQLVVRRGCCGEEETSHCSCKFNG